MIDDAAIAHSQSLTDLLTRRIEEAGGRIPFSEYMQTVLYEPALGYYMAGAQRFGADGDFVTAPQSTALFGQTVARQVVQVLQQAGGEVMELGAGSGHLALSLLQALVQHEATVHLRYTILEPSADLVQQQQNLLREHLPEAVYRQVQWIAAVPELFDGVIIANEVMDALPCERFRCGSVLEQQCVNTQLQTEFHPAESELFDAVSHIEAYLGRQLETGYTSEVNLLLGPWIQALADCLSRGVLLLIDYGYPRSEYYLPERRDGTLACYFRHRMHEDVFLYPGLQDITAHVDFTAVAETAVNAGLDLLGYASQASFLLDNGLLELAEEHRLSATTEAARITVNNEIRLLTQPGEMGERFQVMALGQQVDIALQGFRSQDLSHRL